MSWEAASTFCNESPAKSSRLNRFNRMYIALQDVHGRVIVTLCRHNHCAAFTLLVERLRQTIQHCGRIHHSQVAKASTKAPSRFAERSNKERNWPMRNHRELQQPRHSITFQFGGIKWREVKRRIGFDVARALIETNNRQIEQIARTPKKETNQHDAALTVPNQAAYATPRCETSLTTEPNETTMHCPSMRCCRLCR